MQPGSGGSSRRQCCRPCGPGEPRSLPGSHLAPAAEPGEPRQPRPARPLAPVPPVTAPPRNGDHRAQEQLLNPPGLAARAGDRPAGSAAPRRGPAGRGSAALGPGAARTRTRPGHRSSPSGRSDRPPAGSSSACCGSYLFPATHPGTATAGLPPEHDAFRSGNLSLSRSCHLLTCLKILQNPRKG